MLKTQLRIGSEVRITKPGWRGNTGIVQGINRAGSYLVAVQNAFPNRHRGNNPWNPISTFKPDELEPNQSTWHAIDRSTKNQ